MRSHSLMMSAFMMRSTGRKRHRPRQPCRFHHEKEHRPLLDSMKEEQALKNL